MKNLMRVNYRSEVIVMYENDSNLVEGYLENVDHLIKYARTHGELLDTLKKDLDYYVDEEEERLRKKLEDQDDSNDKGVIFRVEADGYVNYIDF